MLKEGDKAPSFTLTDESGTQVSLSDFAGKKVVVYFYPKDDTPGCTKEACGFRDNYDAILAKGAVVIGISPDDEASHGEFKSKFDLPFYLLADPEKQGDRRLRRLGREDDVRQDHRGRLRSTFVVGEDRTVLKAWPQVNPEEHAEEVLGVL